MPLIPKKIKGLLQNPFFKNVSILASGPIIGQLIVVLASPILTRLFSVESFGVLAVFISVTTVLALFSTGRYELAIVLPKESSNALKLVKLILNIALVVSLILLLLIVILKNLFQINDLTGFLNNNSAYIAPLYIFFVAFFSALNYWHQREKRYKIITFAYALQVIANTAISLLLGFFKVENGMIWGLVIGMMIASLYLLSHQRTLINSVVAEKDILQVARKYKSFPRYMTLSDLSLNANQQLTPILFSVFYSTTIVGHYSLANKMLRLPNIIIAGSIANVFRNEAIDELREHGNCICLYKSTFKRLLFLSFPVYLSLFIISPWAFEFFFGSNWTTAGMFARILSFFLFIEFIATPLNTLFYVREKQRKLMFLQTLNFCMSVGMIFIGYIILNDPYTSLILYATNACIFNIILLFSSYQLAK